MLAVRCHDWMPYQQLKLEDVPAPVLAPGQVRIGTHYAGVSFATSLVTQGRYQRKPPRPFTPGSEVAGEILEVAPDVTALKAGDRVCAAVDWGGHAEEVVTDAATVYPIPDALAFDLAPQFPLSYGTAYAALAWVAAIRPGDILLVHGAAGAVGLATVALAKAMGARVIATASSPVKLDVARAHGADYAVMFPSPAALEQIRAVAPDGVAVVFDPIGGDAFDLSLRCVADCGRILVIGFAAGRIQQIPANILLVKNITVHGFNYGKYIGWGRRDERKQHELQVRAAFQRMFDWHREGRLHPMTSHRFALQDYRAAMDAVLAREGLGKIVLEMPRAVAARK